MVKTHKTAVVVIPPEDTWAPIQAIREEHDRGFRRWMPHITLLYPFWPRPEFEAAAARLAQVCQPIALFEVTLAYFDVFRHGGESHTFWLAPKPKETLVALQTALWHAFPDCDDTRRFPGGFTPHLSVGQARGRERVDEIIRAIGGDWTPITFPVSAVSLIWRDAPPHDVLRVGQNISLATS